MKGKEATPVEQGTEEQALSPEDKIYPKELKAAEKDLIDDRRKAARVKDESRLRVGLALSGGGIRSATVSLGVLQALAESGMLKHVDYLSTVSGGGFIGGFLGRLYEHEKVERENCLANANKCLEAAQKFLLDAERGLVEGTPPAADAEERVKKAEKRVKEAERTVADRVSERLADSRSKPVRFLRENGRYLTPNNGDHFTAIALYIRNWVSLHIVLALVLAPLFLGLALVMHHFGFEDRHDGFWTYVASPIPLLAIITLGVAIVLSLSYWFLLPLRAGSDIENLASRRRIVTYWTGICLRILLFLVALAALDFLGEWALEVVDSLRDAGWLAVLGGVGAVVAWLANWWRARSMGVEGGATVSLPLSVLAGIGALLVWGLILVGYSALGHWLAGNALGADGQFCYQIVAGAVMAGSVIALVVLAVWQRRKSNDKLLFVNQSGVASLYFARITRAYLGAANPKRWKANAPSISEPMSGDDVAGRKYAPHEAGGPLHILNMTLNETVAGRSQLVERDRRGMNFAFGPAGISVAANHNAKWSAGSDESEARLKSLEAPDDFRVWQEPENSEAVRCEALSLGRWIAVSGAAFSTGVGYRGSMALSLLCGAANVRLGYWWNSGIKPTNRDECSQAARTLGWEAVQYLAKAFPVHRYLLAEFLARFPGSGATYWHLSDGGHFENMGVYDLLRRRLPIIIACDNGADPDYGFWDVGNLVRKARIDFGIHIQFRDTKWLRCNGFGPAFGGLEDLRKEKDKDGLSKTHAAVAEIIYRTGEPGTLVLLKPTLTGDEPADVLQYLKEHGDFPQQTTLDQFFTEAQWESYRKLGKHLATATAVSLLERKLGPQ